MKRVTPTEIIELVKRLPEASFHIFEVDNMCYITDEWLVGTFAGCSFEGETIEQAAEKMIEYFYQHLVHNSMVGFGLRQSGFPDLVSVENYCIRENQPQ